MWEVKWNSDEDCWCVIDTECDFIYGYYATELEALAGCEKAQLNAPCDFI